MGHRLRGDWGRRRPVHARRSGRRVRRGCDAGGTDAAAHTLGGIDGLVHAAGRVIPEPVGAYTQDSWDAVLDVSLRAQAMLVQLLLPHLERCAQRGGGPAIVGIASIEALAANPYIPAYCASKAGLLGLTRSMAAQFGPLGIRINAVCPGFIQTPMLQMRWTSTKSESASSRRRRSGGSGSQRKSLRPLPS
jgi:NAD(P)-dependent dehydrogenase (short-subunit alcohol dehydrogenase family)